MMVGKKIKKKRLILTKVNLSNSQFSSCISLDLIAFYFQNYSLFTYMSTRCTRLFLYQKNKFKKN